MKQQKQIQKQEQVKVYVCPKCQSTEVSYIFRLVNLYGIIPRMECKKCHFESVIFPQWVIDKNKLNKLNEKLKKQGKKRK